MAMSDEAMFAPPQGITIEAVNGMLAERFAQKHGKASLLRAFIPLPPPSSATVMPAKSKNGFRRKQQRLRISGTLPVTFLGSFRENAYICAHYVQH